MPCYSPIAGWYSRELNENGKRPVVFNPREGYADMAVSVPCGKCIGCQLKKSCEWALRCIHEASLYEENSFVTLTYDDEHLPKDWSLDKSHMQKFFKRLRRQNGKGIRYLYCGEYGDRTYRPHYHIALFNWMPRDREIYNKHSKGVLYSSRYLEELWGKGFVTLSDLNYETCAYVARYVLKKQSNKSEDYGGRTPPYINMSNRPGIGTGWYEKYKNDVFPDDFIVHQNRKHKPPRYYIEKYGLTDKFEYAKLKVKRKIASLNNPDNSLERLFVKEEVKKAQTSVLERKL